MITVPFFPGLENEGIRPRAYQRGWTVPLLTLISTWPADGTGTGSSRMARADGGPGASRTAARMMPGTAAVPAAAPGGKALRLAGGFPDPVPVIPASTF
jgi:hypothetical protein